MPLIEQRCRGTQRGQCGYPLTEPLDKMRKRCSDHFTEWLTNIDQNKCTVLYHDNCDDGFGAAWIAHKVLPKASFVPVQYGNIPPVIKRGSTIFLLDFAYPYEYMKRWLIGGNFESIIVLDHHKTAYEELGKFVKHTYFNLNKSGAMIAWDFFFAPFLAPKLIEYVQDRDLWIKQLEYCDQVTAAIKSYSRTFESWDELEKINTKDLIIDGYGILRYVSQQVNELCKRARIINIGSNIVPVVNTSNLMSEVGNELCKIFIKYPFSATYFDREDGNRHWSLRSIGDFDVSQVAQQFGGGGHKNAAGFVTSTPTVSLIIKDNENEATSKKSGRSKGRKKS